VKVTNAEDLEGTHIIRGRHVRPFGTSSGIRNGQSTWARLKAIGQNALTSSRIALHVRETDNSSLMGRKSDTSIHMSGARGSRLGTIACGGEESRLFVAAAVGVTLKPGLTRFLSAGAALGRQGSRAASRA